MDSKINELLTSEAYIRLIPADKEERIIIKAGSRCHCKVLSKNKPIPLRLKFDLNKGDNLVYLYLSHIVERPNKEHYEKVYLMRSEETNILYSIESSKKRLFTHEAICFTLEPRDECAITVLAEFGKSKLSAKRQQSYMNLTSRKENVEDSFVFTPRKTIKLRYPAVSIRQRKGFFSIKRHRANVLRVKNKNDNVTFYKKLILVYKDRVSTISSEIVKRKVNEYSEYKQGLYYWINLVLNYRMAYTLYKKMTMLRIIREVEESDYCKKARMYIGMQSLLKLTAEHFKDRMRLKLFQYLYC